MVARIHAKLVMMISVSRDRAQEILKNAQGHRIAVIGDFMLDRHLKGAVRRISPEAPVPVVEIESETTGLGGAGNVVNNLATLGAMPVVFGVAGADPAGQVMLAHLEAVSADATGIIVSKARHTTEKMRIIAYDQHVVRADRETPAELSTADENRLIAALESVAASLRGIILQDYNKGVLTKRCIGSAIQIAERHKIPVYVDPKFEHFFEYRSVHLFKPNIRELATALGVSIRDDNDVLAAGKTLYDRLTPEFLLVTRGERGISLFLNRNKIENIPTSARKVHDVSGAGDTVIATYAVSEIGGAIPIEAAVIANEAAGVVCGEVGVVPIEPSRLLDAIGEI